MQYFITPNNCIALNSKVATNSIAKAIVQTYYPDKVEMCIIESDYQWRSFIEQTDTPDKPVLMLLRDPIERFVSAVAMLNLDPAEVIKDIGSYEPNYFQPQSLFLDDHPDAKVFLFPSQIDEFCKAAGFPELPAINEAKNPKPELTKEQIEFLKEYYATDIKLFKKHGK